MFHSKRSALSFAGLLLVSACSSSSGSRSDDAKPFRAAENVKDPVEFARAQGRPLFRLAFSSHVNGEVGECGCAVNPKGGADRRLNYIIEQTQTPNQGELLTLDAGNALFPNARLDKGLADDQKARAAFILRAHSLMGVRVENVGHLDLAAGTEFLQSLAKQNGISLVSSNLVDEKGRPIFSPEFRLTLAPDIKVAIMGLSAGGPSLPAGMRVSDPAETLRERLLSVPADHIVVLLSDLGRGTDERLAKETKRPMIIVGARDMNSLESPRHVGSSLLLQPQIQGQQWGLLTVAWSPKAQGWYNPELAEKYSSSWDRLKNDRELMQGVSSELAPYSSDKLENKFVYSHKLTDMSVQYGGKNVLTNEVLAFKKPVSGKRGN